MIAEAIVDLVFQKKVSKDIAKIFLRTKDILNQKEEKFSQVRKLVNISWKFDDISKVRH